MKNASSKSLQHFKVKLAIKGAYNHEWYRVEKPQAKAIKQANDLEDDEAYLNYFAFREGAVDNELEPCLFSDKVQISIQVFDARNKSVYHDQNAKVSCLSQTELAKKKDNDMKQLHSECQKLWEKDDRTCPLGYYMLALHNMDWMGFDLEIDAEEFDISKLSFIQVFKCSNHDDPLFSPYRMAYDNCLIVCHEKGFEDEEDAGDWDEYGTECFLVEKKDKFDHWERVL